MTSELATTGGFTFNANSNADVPRVRRHSLLKTGNQLTLDTLLRETHKLTTLFGMKAVFGMPTNAVPASLSTSNSHTVRDRINELSITPQKIRTPFQWRERR